MQSLLCCAFPDRMVLSHALSCAHAQDNEHDTNLNQPPATHHAPGGRPVLARHARSRPPRRRHLRPRRALDANLLPPVVPGAQAAPPQRHLLPDARGSGTPRLSSLLARPGRRFRWDGSASRDDSRGVPLRRSAATSPSTGRAVKRNALSFVPACATGPLISSSRKRHKGRPPDWTAAARRPDVPLHPTREKAEPPGYRPCLRCPPNELSGPVALVQRAAGLLAQSTE